MEHYHEYKKVKPFIRLRISVIEKYLKEKISQHKYGFSVTRHDDILKIGVKSNIHFSVALPVDRVHHSEGKTHARCFAELMIRDNETYYQRQNFGLSPSEIEDQVFDIKSIQELDPILRGLSILYGGSVENLNNFIVIARISEIQRHITTKIDQGGYNFKLIREKDHLEVCVNPNVHFDIKLPRAKIRLDSHCFAELTIHDSVSGISYQRQDFGLSADESEDKVININNLDQLDIILAKIDSWYGSTLD